MDLSSLLDLEVDWGALLSTTGGASIILILFKALLTKLLLDLRSVIKNTAKLATELSAISARIKDIDKLQETIQFHDREIITLKEKIKHAGKRGIYKID